MFSPSFVSLLAMAFCVAWTCESLSQDASPRSLVVQHILTKGQTKYFELNQGTGQWQQVTDIDAIKKLTNFSDPPLEITRNCYRTFLDRSNTYQVKVQSQAFDPVLSYGYNAKGGIKRADPYSDESDISRFTDFVPGLTDFQWFTVESTFDDESGAYEFFMTDYWKPGAAPAPGTYGDDMSDALLASSGSIRKSDGSWSVIYLNFDGCPKQPAESVLKPGGEVSPFTPPVNNPILSADAWKQHLMYKVRERFAPFAVTVQPMTGSGEYSRNLGDATVFIGDNSINNQGGFNGDSAVAYRTVDDFNFGSKKVGVAFVDPFSSGSSFNSRDVVGIIAHEVGHTFGLVHTRTVGSDPDKLSPVNEKNPPEVMSYDGFPTRFIYKPFPISLYNFDDKKNEMVLGDDSARRLNGVAVKTQNSFLYLNYLFGSCPWDDLPNVADPTVYDDLTWQDMDYNSDLSFKAEYQINPLGDYDVLQLDAGGKGTVRIQPAPGSNWVPIALLYGEGGKGLIRYSEAPSGQALEIYYEAPEGVQYRLVIGAKDNASIGSYCITISE